MRQIEINASKKYRVLLEDGLLSDAGALISEFAPPGTRLCVVSDETVASLYGGRRGALFSSLKSAGFDVYAYVFPGGEKNKNIGNLENILEYLAAQRFDRKDLVIALGGGVTGDLAGFAASVYMRGTGFIQVPTTLLAAVDASIGGKTGVNLSAGKNLAGTFFQPELVIIDTSVFESLSDRLRLDGMAEILKAGIIGDETILRDAASPGFAPENGEALNDMIIRALDVKRRIVEADEREEGKRRLLNLGHTAGHAIEKCSGYAISHGEAVASGICMSARAADSLGWSSQKNAGRIAAIFERFGFEPEMRYSAEELALAAMSDKKIRGGAITIVYPDRPGRCAMRTIALSGLREFMARGLA